MATTTNYGWTTPDDTALVKDGASAIRTLGSSVDTTTKALNPSTTLGDIEYRSSTANTNTRLGIGSTGTVLTVAGGVPTWAAVSAGGMTLISSTTLSGATTTLSSIPQTYNDLYVLVVNPTMDVLGRVQLSPNNDATLSNYQLVKDNSAANGQVNEPIALSGLDAILATGGNHAFACTINNYASTTAYKPFFTYGFGTKNDSTNKTYFSGGAFRSNTAITSLVVNYSNSAVASGGTVLLYGVK